MKGRGPKTHSQWSVPIHRIPNWSPPNSCQTEEEELIHIASGPMAWRYWQTRQFKGRWQRANTLPGLLKLCSIEEGKVRLPWLGVFVDNATNNVLNNAPSPNFLAWALLLELPRNTPVHFGPGNVFKRMPIPYYDIWLESSGCLLSNDVESASFEGLQLKIYSMEEGKHVGNVLEPFQGSKQCFLALATSMARLVGVGNVVGAPCGRWQPGWCLSLALAT
ncbi:uncharacterized protein DS421_1g14990 [Arachis hypogaea]|nr:uncharacterized protein DS421_1g14990 [Arachis hypogaea]